MLDEWWRHAAQHTCGQWGVRTIELDNVVHAQAMLQLRLAGLHDRAHLAPRVVPRAAVLVVGARVRVGAEQLCEAVEARPRAHELERVARILMHAQHELAVFIVLEATEQQAVGLRHLAHRVRRVARHEHGLVVDAPVKSERTFAALQVSLQFRWHLDQPIVVRHIARGRHERDVRVHRRMAARGVGGGTW